MQAIERLESRRLLSGDVRISSTGALLVFGDVGANRVEIDRAAGVTTVVIDGRSQRFADGDFRRVNVELAGGDDVAAVGDLGVPVWLLGGNGDDVLVGSGDAFNLLTGGAGNDVLVSRFAGDRLVGGRGFDTADSVFAPRVTLQTVDRTATVDIGPYRFDVLRNLSFSGTSLGDLADLVPAVTLDGYALPTLAPGGRLVLDASLDPRSVTARRVSGVELIDLDEDRVVGDGFVLGFGYGVFDDPRLAGLTLRDLRGEAMVRVDVAGRGSTFVPAATFRGLAFALEPARNPAFGRIGIVSYELPPFPRPGTLGGLSSTFLSTSTAGFFATPGSLIRGSDFRFTTVPRLFTV